MASNDFIYEMISKKVIEQLEKGVVPWRQPWNDATFPRSIDGHRYRGINVFLLGNSGYQSPYWMTWKAAKRHGGSVKSSESKNGTTIIFWKMLVVRDEETDEVKRIPRLQYYRVWNWEQTEGVREPKDGAFPEVDTNADLTYEDRHNAASEIVRGYLKRNGPTLTHDGGMACYYPTHDHVRVPAIERFNGLDEYYSTLFHELGHSTAHPTRCDRKSDHRFGSHSYGVEELCAEMTATFLCSASGIDSTFDNSASYLSGWIAKIREEPKALIRAAAQAQRATDCILGTAQDAEQDEAA